MDIITAQTGNRIVDRASIGARFVAGCALTMAALWDTHSPFIVTTAITVGSTMSLLAFKLMDFDKPKKAFTPLLLGATVATFILAYIRLFKLEQGIIAYAEQNKIALWKWQWIYQPGWAPQTSSNWTVVPSWRRIQVWNWAAQCAPEQVSHLNTLFSAQKIPSIAMFTSLIGLGAQAFMLCHQPRNSLSA